MDTNKLAPHDPISEVVSRAMIHQAMSAVQRGEADFMEALCEHGFDIGVQAKDGTPVADMVASARGNPAAEVHRKWRFPVESAAIVGAIGSASNAPGRSGPRV